jgi:hypothetical protein
MSDGLLDADRRQFFQLHDQVAFIHRRHEALAEQHKSAGRSEQGNHGADDEAAAVGEGSAQHAVVERRQLSYQPGFVMYAALDQIRGEHRYHGQREQQRGGERKNDGQRDRPEHFALQPLQGEQRQKDDDDDDDAGGDRRGDFAGGAENQVQRRQIVRRLGELAFDVFNDHHRGIDQHADGDGQAAQTHQIGRKAGGAHQDEGGERGERQHQRDDQRRAQVAEEGEEQQDNQHDGFEQRFRHRTDSAVDQIAAVVEGFDADALGQGRGNFGQPGFDAGDHGLRIGAAQAEHQALHRFALAIFGDCAIAGQATKANFSDIGNSHDVAILGLQNNGFYVVDRTNGPFGPHQQRFFAIGQAAGAVVAVIGFQYGLQILQRQTAGGQALRVGHDFKGADFAAQTIHIGDAGNGAQLRPDHPVEQAAFFRQRQIALDGEHEHLAKWRGDRCHAAGNAGWQVAHRGSQAFADLLAGPVNIGAILEIDGDVS